MENNVADYLAFALLFGLFFVILRIFRRIVLKKVKEIIKKTGRGDVLVSIIDTVKAPLYWYLAFYLSVNILNLHPSLNKVLEGILVIWISYQAVLVFQVFIDRGLQSFIVKESDSGSQVAMSNIGKIVKVIVWFFAALFALSNIGINVTSVMAGLGIGGIAIAFALQNILSDLFSSFAIFFDKPFAIGDFIIVGEHMGVVENIGIKTTRLRALQGEEIVISNRELTTSKIQNFKKLKKRRIVFHFGVTYDTSLDKLKKIPEMIKRIVDGKELAEIDRAHFFKFADYSLDFEVVYYFLSADYNEYMDTHENILFDIKDKFEKEDIQMAFPTQTVILEK